MNELTRDQKMDAARARMAELGAKFLERTDVDIITMRGALARLARGDAAAMSDLRHLSHRMVGTGATLGFEALSECAHRIERLTDGCAPGVLPDDSLRVTLAAALDSLAAELRRQRAD
jgi:chemotaxis protein histidine kinase CheA